MWPDCVIYWTLGKFFKPLATINLLKSPTFLRNFCKGVKINHFIVKSFLATFMDTWQFFSGHAVVEQRIIMLPKCWATQLYTLQICFFIFWPNFVYFNFLFNYAIQWQIQKIKSSIDRSIKSWKSIDGLLGIWTRGCSRWRIEGIDEPSEPWRPLASAYSLKEIFSAFKCSVCVSVIPQARFLDHTLLTIWTFKKAFSNRQMVGPVVSNNVILAWWSVTDIIKLFLQL